MLINTMNQGCRLDEFLAQEELPILVEDFKKKYPSRFNEIVGIAGFLKDTTLVSNHEINEGRKTRLLSIPQQAKTKFVDDEISGISNELETFEEPFKYVINSILQIQKRYIELFVKDNVKIPENLEFDFTNWKVLLIWKFSIHLCLLHSSIFDAFYLKVFAQRKNTGFQISAAIVNAMEDNLKGIKKHFQTNPLKDELVLKLRMVIKLLLEWQALTEYSFYLDVDNRFNYEDFVDDYVPIRTKSIPSIVTGFSKEMSDTQIHKLYELLIDRKFIECDKNDFKALFTDNPVSIQWIDKSKTHPKKPNKQTIFELFYLLFEADLVTRPDVEHSNSNNFYRKLETIFPDVKNFANSSGSGKAKQKTEREKLLKQIIDELALVNRNNQDFTS